MNPFENPPAVLLEGAIGWHYESTDDGPGRWKPVAWVVVYPDHVLTIDYNTKLAYRDIHLRRVCGQPIFVDGEQVTTCTEPHGTEHDHA